ncbi:hypothetical protein CHRY9390_00913 [Chryseobacterium aquaeductus]|uniref:Uncharacterized protein n=1 Tax=Chryseobacterium aquaeductus TaxID=2675056 RepID=A0A9N8QRF8_9FLAO|nr:hypothetical protein [Chryseobacterium aquaeductus]CAA7330252.1 hypothetical protein CHRY9390_00913 [Chryseobacterium potabilaquae]CAD7802334.1 hypothetical protein CHRY9390_00913 [Chryseobacterium aquaeductus]
MSTNNLNTNNNASQTLFRFASMRNAELSDPKNKERRFIFRKDTQKGIFDTKLNSSTTLQKLCEVPSTLPLTIETEQTLKAKDSAFYDLAIWVARNKTTATKAEFDAKIKEYKDYLITTKKAMFSIDSSLWDNLVYQVTTQKDFYAKETLMQFLHLNHILAVYTDGNEGVYNDVIKAKVVLPKELFKVDNGTTSGSTSTTKTATQAAPKVAYNDAGMKFAEAKMDLHANQNLVSVLDAMEKTYRKQYQQAHKEALTAYERKVAPARKEYQNQLEEVNSRKKVAESRIDYLSKMSIAHPELFLKDERSQEELRSLNEELARTTPAPELPEFSFEFQPEVEAGNLQSQLTEDQKNTLNKVLQSASTSLENISAFAELNQLISQNNQALQQTVLDNTVLNQQVSTSVGGVVVPVTNSANANGWIPYSVKTYNRNNNDWFIMLTIDNYAHNIVSGTYKVTINGVETTSSNVFQAVNGVNFLFYNGVTIPASQTERINGFILSGEVVLEDGKTYILDVTMIRDESDMNAVLKQGAFKGSAAFTLKEQTGGGTGTGSGTTPTTPVGVYTPSGFGMKNIGITDYKKVEQSTYCYVEGDVAHIENIMAREYKERATRRLKRNESQTTKSSESEKEKLTDTTSTERHEMQSEVAKILQESKDFSAQAGFSASWGMGGNKYGLNIGANYATHNSKEESNRQAVTEAKDITARALDRIVTKVKEERIDKIIEEYEENNKHGFDNTKGSSHVVGVYRWVDKVVKNQIYNYGKRMMFEFMIPEPAKLHNLGMKISKNAENQLVKPVDPRESSVQKLENFSSLEDETKLKFWLNKYNVEIDDKPAYSKKISFSFADKNIGQDVDGVYGRWTGVYNNNDFKIDDGFCATKVTGAINVGVGAGTRMNPVSHVYICGVETGGNVNMTLSNVEKAITVSSLFWDIRGISGSLVADIVLTQEAKNAWLQKAFNKIIEAYQVELSKYEQALADAKAMGVQIKGSNPGFYRKIENTILRRNCISYMLEQNPSVDLTFGKKRYYTNDGGAEETFTNTDIKVDGKLDQYAAFIKFMEQAFEWEIMSYYFYPYYWGERKGWGDLYQFDDNDPVFRAFMQSGMARVIVTVRPGFEEVVRHFLSTGQIWNGGEVPVIDDTLFLSIVDEMRAPQGTKEGEPWREKLPTSLTILQADSIGLKVEKALPCNCEPGVKFDDNLGEMCGSNFELNQNQVGQTTDKWMQITFSHLDNNMYFKTIGDMDAAGLFPRQYECMGHAILVDRDAKWQKTDPITKFYQALADEISQIEGIEAYVSEDEGITLKILASKITNFMFRKPGGTNEFDLLKFSIDIDSGYVKFISPEYGSSSSDRILDKDGHVIPKAEYLDKVPLSKFLV